MAWAVRPALCFLFLSRNLFLYFLYSNSLWTKISFPAKYSKKMEPCEPLKPATVLRTVQFDRGSSGFMHFSHRTVLRVKRTTKMNDWRFFRSDRTVWSGFQNHNGHHILLSTILHTSSKLPNYISSQAVHGGTFWTKVLGKKNSLHNLVPSKNSMLGNISLMLPKESEFGN